MPRMQRCVLCRPKRRRGVRVWKHVLGGSVTNSFQDADRYERLMGRWSRRLAPLLIRFGGLADGDRVLDMGCGTGSLIFALPGFAEIASAAGIDLTESYIAAARARNTDARFTFDVGDACALPYPDSSFDRAFSLLVLHFIPEARKAVEEMRRVVRPGGTVTAAVWDNYGGQPFARILWDIAGVLDPTLERPFFRPLNGPGEMESAMAGSRATRRRAGQLADPYGIPIFRGLLVAIRQRRGAPWPVCRQAAR